MRPLIPQATCLCTLATSSENMFCFLYVLSFTATMKQHLCYGRTAFQGCLTICAVCADAYHSGCHEPRIPEKTKPPTRWLCINCEMPEELKINEIQSNMSNSFSQKLTNGNGNRDFYVLADGLISYAISDTNDNNSSSPSISGNTTPNYQSPPLSPTPPQLSPQNEVQQNGDGGVSDSQSNQSNKDSDDDNIDPSIPDATNWSAEEVYQYFAQYFPKEANIFREQVGCSEGRRGWFWRFECFRR